MAGPARILVMISKFAPLLFVTLLGSASLVMAQDHDRPGQQGGGRREGPPGGGGQPGHPNGGQNRAPEMARPGPAARPDGGHGNPGDRPDQPQMARPGGNDMRPSPADRPGMGSQRPAPPVSIMPTRPGGDFNNGRPGGNGNDGRPGGNGNDGRPGGGANAGRPGGDFHNPRPGGNYSYNRPPPGNYWRPDGGRPSANWWQNGHWNQRPVYAPAYQYPRGYSYRRWSPGLILPSLFFGSGFFFDQFFDLGLPSPPYGYRWVRYGPDLLLVNTRTGRIRDVRYGVFG